MSKEAERIINRSKTEHLHWLKMKESGDEIVKNNAKQLEKDFDLKDIGDPKFKTKRFLRSLISKTTLINEIDSKKYSTPYLLFPGFNDAFLVLERKLISSKRPYNESTKGLPSDYTYTEAMALGYRKVGDEYEVGFFGKNENDNYLCNHPDDGDFNPKDAGMLFTKTVVSEEDIILTLALAMASYEYNKGKTLNDQITFPSEI